MWIKIIIIIFVILIYFYFTSVHIRISYTLLDFPKFINNEVTCIHIKNFYPKKLCIDILNKIKNINKSFIKPWRYSRDKVHDVYIFQIPLSDVLNDLSSPNEYINQRDWNIYDNIVSPIDLFIKNMKQFNIQKCIDSCLINRFPKYNDYKGKFQESIVRIYKPNSYHSKEGLPHIDVDSTGYYDNYNIYSINNLKLFISIIFDKFF